MHDDLITRIVDADPTKKLRRGRVWCRTCGSTRRVLNGLRNGWPKCCGYTMTIDSPEEQAALKASGQGGR